MPSAIRVHAVHARVTGVAFACIGAALKICWPGELQHISCKSGFKPALDELSESKCTHPAWVHFRTAAGSVTLESWLNQLQIALDSATCIEELGHRLTWPGCPGWSGRSSGHSAGSKCPLKSGQHRQLGAVTFADVDHELELLLSWLAFALKQITNALMVDQCRSGLEMMISRSARAEALDGEMQSKKGMDHNRFYKSGDTLLFLPISQLFSHLCFFSCLFLASGFWSSPAPKQSLLSQPPPQLWFLGHRVARHTCAIGYDIRWDIA